MTSEKDIVLIYLEDTPMSFARVETITADWKKNWYHVKLMMLQVPVQVVTWILKDIYIDGTEFTMNGKRMRMEKVVCPEDAPPETDESPTESPASSKPESDTSQENVITFKKRNDP